MCHLVLSPDFKGYGFNLHTVKEKPGQFIGQVDEGSPAERALLKQGDRIIEVNGVNIANENHKQVRLFFKARIPPPPPAKLFLISVDQGRFPQSVIQGWFSQSFIICKFIASIVQK